jgi:hypothetical protein
MEVWASHVLADIPLGMQANTKLVLKILLSTVGGTATIRAVALGENVMPPSYSDSFPMATYTL